MFQSRLQGRLRELNMDSFEKYCQHIFNPAHTISELSKMVDYISTNKTEFFREAQHFDLLLSRILPEISTGHQLIRCWSAGCSTGQEAFSMAMTLEEFRRNFNGVFDYSIWGSDISNKVLKIAREGVYSFSQSAFIPPAYLKKYVLKSKDPQNPRIKIAASIRSKVIFSYGNLMDVDYKQNFPFTIIFIRNTLIYFNREHQQQIVKRILNCLENGGYLFIGHSESLIDWDLPVRLVGPSLYQKHKL